MSLTKDGFYKQIGGVTGDNSYVLLAGGGHQKFGNKSSYIPISNGTKNVNLNADLLDGYHYSSFSFTSHTHKIKLGATEITVPASGETPTAVQAIIGPFAINTQASSDKAFSIQRESSAEGVQHWVDDGQYHIDYTNDETSSSIHIRVINTDTEAPHNPRQTTDYHYYLDCYGNIYPGSNNTGSIGTSSYKWANMYATTFHGALEGNASSATKLQTARTINGVSFDGTTNITIAPSLPISGNTIAVKVGNQTSGYITVPYASSAGALTSVIGEDKLPPRLRAYSQNTSTNRNVDTLNRENGFYWSNSGTLPANVGDIDIITVNANTSYGHQLGFKFSGNGTTGESYDGRDIYTRIFNNGSYKPWYVIYTAGNTGWVYNDQFRYEPHSKRIICLKTSDGWNQQIYSKQSYIGNCSFSFKPANKTGIYMIGLNTDPTSSASYESIDYCFYLHSNGNVYIYESNSNPMSYSGYNAGDEFKIEYADGYVRYYHNGVIKRTVTRSGSGAFYIDSCFYRASEIYDVEFRSMPQAINHIYGTDNTPANAMLHSGPSRPDNASGNTWLFVDDAGGYTSTWGIFHNQVDNRIEFYGAGLLKSYINLSTGKFYTGRAKSTAAYNNVISIFHDAYSSQTANSNTPYNSEGSWGISFDRGWSDSYNSVNSAGIYAYGTGAWGTGLVFRVKGSTSYNTGHDRTALDLLANGQVKAPYGFIGNLTGNISGNADTVDGYHQDHLLPYRYTYGAQTNSGSTDWYVRIQTTNYISEDCTIYVRGNGNNTTSDFVLHVLCRDNRFWGWETSYNGVRINGIAKETGAPEIIYLRMPSSTTSITFKSTHSLTIDKADYSSKSYMSLGEGLFANYIYGRIQNADYATSAGNADTVDGYHANRFAFTYNSANYGNSSGVTVNDLVTNGVSNASHGMIYSGTDNPYSSSGNWVHVWSQQWTIGTTSSWVSQIALGVQQGTGMWYRTTSGNIVGRGWTRVLDSSNWTSYGDGRYLRLSGGWMDTDAQIYFKGANSSTSVYGSIGYRDSFNGKMHLGSDTYNTKALYICSNGYNAANDCGGIAIDNDGVTAFGAGDTGSVFRVLNEDNVGDGAQFAVTKASGVSVKRWLHINTQNSGTDNGITFYGSDANYSIMCRNTSQLGTFGDVSADWAMYFNMNNNNTRGWIFRRWGSANVFSISARGYVYGARLWLSHYSNVSPGYSWTNSALTTPSIEIQNYTGTTESMYPTLTLHHYGYGGPRLGSRQGVLTIYGGNTDAKTLGSRNSYFKSMKIYPEEFDGLYVNDIKVLLGYRRLNLNISSTDSGMIPPDILGFKNGYPLYTDPEFASGNNSISVYNNSGGTAVTITREASTTSGNSSGYCLHIHSSASNASPYGGGFYFASSGARGKVYVCIFRAFIPSGYSVVFHTNSIGSGGNSGWLTSQTGTGKYEWYAYMVEWGTASLSSTFFFTLNAAANVDWYLSYANVIDITRGNYDGLRTRYSDYADSLTNPGKYYWANLSMQTSPNASTSPTFNITTHNGEIQANAGIMWKPGTNIRLPQSGNSQEWSFDITRNGYTGGYWHVWDSAYGSLLTVYPDNGNVLANRYLGVGGTNLSYTFHVSGTGHITGRLYEDEWIQFPAYTGLYWPNANPGSHGGAHFHPNNNTSYGTFTIRGARNRYSGIQLGTSTSYMTIMDNGNDKGAYEEDWGWIWYFNRSNKKMHLRTSSDMGADINLNGHITALNFRIYGSAAGWNCNDAYMTGHFYYTSNGPSTSIGASTSDGGLYTQAYSSSWVGQIAQDYRNGGLYVRGKNNGTWQSWYTVLDTRNYVNIIGAYPYGYVMKETLVDLSGLDGNTYYPITFGIGAHSNVRIEVRVSLNTGRTDTNWMTHSNGFSFRCIWEVNGSGWGTNPITRTIYAYNSAFTNIGHPGGEIGQLSNASVEYIYLRGHAKYYIYTSHNITPVVQSSTYTASSQSVAPKSSIDTSGRWGASWNIFPELYGGGSSLYMNVGGTLRGYNIGDLALYWANLRVQTSSRTDTSPTVSTIYASNWFRSTGATGWYSESYGGGIRMTDSSWIRTYGSKHFYVEGGNFAVSGNAGIGRTSMSYRLDVQGDSYTRGWARADSGFYCEGNGVHYTHAGAYGEIYTSSNNVFNFTTGSWTTLYFNYGSNKFGNTYVTNFIWNAGSSTTYAGHTAGYLNLFPGSRSNWGEGIRIHSASNGWTSLILCGTDLTGDSGTSANSWSLHTNGGNFYLNKNNSSGALATRLWGHANGYTVGSTSRASANLTVTSWIEVTGAASATMSYATTNPRITFSESGSQAVGIVYTDYDSYRTSKGLKVMDVDNTDTGNVWLEVQGSIYGNTVYSNLAGSSTSGGLSLYSTDANTYAVMFRGTGNRGKWGDVQSDWATYFTMSNTAQRGWVWQSGTAEANMSAALSVRGVFATRAVGNNAGYLAFPQNNSYYTSTATVTGALKIILPRYQTNCMLMFDVNIFTYDEGTSNIVTYRIGGYEYGSTGWYAPVSKAFSYGRGDKVNLNVRFGYDGSKTCVTIGETNTTWKYPQVSITNVTYGYSDVAISSWGYGWGISFTTTLPSSVSTTFTDPYFNGMYWANVRISNTSSTSTSPTFNTCYTSNWFRSTGNTGWYNHTHGGGWYMTDSTWVRTYNSKGVVATCYYASNWASAYYLLRSDGGAAKFNYSSKNSSKPTYVWGWAADNDYRLYNVANIDTHWTSYLRLGAINTTSDASTTNGNTYLKLVENGSVRATQIKIVGSGATTVSSNASGVLTISSTDTNTDTHWTSYLRLGAASTTTNASTTNGNTYLKLVENGSVRDTQIKIVGSGNTTVSSNASGVLTINSSGGISGMTISNNSSTTKYLWGFNATSGTTSTVYTDSTVYSTGGHIYLTNGNMYVGSTSNSAERQIRCRSAAGEIYMYSKGSSSGERGLYGYNSRNIAHDIITVKSNNRSYFHGHLACLDGFGSGDGMPNSCAFSYYATDGSFYGYSGWCHYLICNHGDGASYYNYVIGLPFWSPPMYKRQTVSSSSTYGWYRFYTEENLKGGTNVTITWDSSANAYKINASGGSSISKSNSCSSNRYIIGTDSYSTSSSFTTAYCNQCFYFTTNGAYHSSDARKKYDIRDILNDDVNRLFETENGFIRHFKWISTNEDAYGFIAQELQEYCPEAVDLNNDDGYYSVNYNVAFSKIIGAMFKKIKEQEQIINKLQRKMEVS